MTPHVFFSVLAFLIAGLCTWVAYRQQDPPTQWIAPPSPTTPTSPEDVYGAAPTDGLFAADVRSLAAAMGRRTHELIRRRADPEDVYVAARRAFRYAFLVDPQLRAPTPRAIVFAWPSRRSARHLVERVP